MSLKAEPVRIGKKGYKEAMDLMSSTFPPNELIPLWILRLFALRRNVRFRAFYDDDMFIGTVYTYEDDKHFFILYLAVDPKYRSMGYGGRIVDHAHILAEGRNIALDVESLDPGADNLEERERRIAFYARHGIFDTGYDFTDDGESYYSVLSSDIDGFDMDAFVKMLRRFSFGLCRMKVSKREGCVQNHNSMV